MKKPGRKRRNQGGNDLIGHAGRVKRFQNRPRGKTKMRKEETRRNLIEANPDFLFRATNAVTKRKSRSKEKESQNTNTAILWSRRQATFREFRKRLY